MPIFPGLHDTTAVSMSLFSHMHILGLEELILAYRITLFKRRTTEGISAVMIVIDEVTLGSRKLEVGAVLAHDGKLSSSMRRKASVIVGECGDLVSFREVRLSHRIKNMYKSRTLRSFLVVMLVDSCTLGSVPYKRSVSCLFNVSVKL